MKTTSAIAMLATLATVSNAVDIRHYPSSGCNDNAGGYSECPNQPKGLCCSTRPPGSPPWIDAVSTRFIGLFDITTTLFTWGWGMIFDNPDSVGGRDGCHALVAKSVWGNRPCADRLDETASDHSGAMWVGITTCAVDLCGQPVGKPGIGRRDAVDAIPAAPVNGTENCRTPSHLVFAEGHKFYVGNSTPESDANLLWGHWGSRTKVRGAYWLDLIPSSKLPLTLL